jgi:hypothetical protein
VRRVYIFCSRADCNDGSGPSAGMIAINGQLYGTAASGGASEHYGGVFKLKESGSGLLESSYLFDLTDGAEPVAPLCTGMEPFTA